MQVLVLLIFEECPSVCKKGSKVYHPPFNHTSSFNEHCNNLPVSSIKSCFFYKVYHYIKYVMVLSDVCPYFKAVITGFYA